MFPIIFYTFGKNVNSTKRPTVGGVSYNIHLLEPTSVTHPRVTLADKENPAFNPSPYNYAYIEHFGRYYFVTDWAWIGGRWAASLSVDVLASFKPQILASEQYVTRSASQFDGNVPDGLYPASTFYAIPRVSNNPFTHRLSEGCYVLGIMNDDPATMGGVSYYVLNNSQFRALTAALMGDGQFSGATEEFVTLTKSLTTPFRYLTSCLWFPFSSFQTSGATENLPYGWYTLPGVSCNRLASNSVAVHTVSIDVAKHPQNERGEYLNRAPYSRYVLSWPAVGTYSLDPAKVGNAEQVSVSVAVDPISGGADILIFADDMEVMRTKAQIGVPIQLSDMTVDYIGTATGFVSDMGGAVTKAVNANSVAGAVGHMALGYGSAVLNAIEHIQPVLQSSGSNGSASSFVWSPRLLCEFWEVVDEDREHRGRPLMKKKTLADLEGFTLCSDAEIELPATSGEVESVKSFLNGGVYLE